MANAHSTLASLFTDIAKAIRSKTGGTGAIVADKFPEAIAGISVGVDTSDATASAGDIVSGKTAWVNGSKVTGTLVPTSVVTGQVSSTTYETNGRTSTISGLPTNKNNMVIYLNDTDRSIISTIISYVLILDGQVVMAHYCGTSGVEIYNSNYNSYLRWNKSAGTLKETFGGSGAWNFNSTASYGSYYYIAW